MLPLHKGQIKTQYVQILALKNHFLSPAFPFVSLHFHWFPYAVIVSPFDIGIHFLSHDSFTDFLIINLASPLTFIVSSSLKFSALFAVSSAFSLPSTPTCAGTQQHCMSIPALRVLSIIICISNSKSSLMVYVTFTLLRAAVESEQMTTLSGLTSSIHCSPKIIATISAVYTDSRSLIILHIVISKSGMNTPDPTCPVTGSLDPSVKYWTISIMVSLYILIPNTIHFRVLC